MGFYINDCEVDLKQHLNLTEHAWFVIENDIDNFYISENEKSFSGFLNRVFTNFYPISNASIVERLQDKRYSLQNLFNDKQFKKVKDNILEIFIKKILNVYENELTEQAISYPKGEGKKFRINKQNVELLKDSLNEEYFDDNIGKYLKAIFEEYSSMHSYQREQVFFSDTVNEIKLAISEQKKLKLVVSTYNGSKKFYISPYKIIQDKAFTYNYLVGVSEEILQGGNLGDKKIASFRISRITNIRTMSSMNGFLSKATIDNINNEIAKKEPQYLLGDVVDVSVKFTDEGLISFRRQLYLRPNFYDVVDRYNYVFHCTAMQAFNYFFKFGKDAVITSPHSLVDAFRNKYADSIKEYNIDN